MTQRRYSRKEKATFFTVVIVTTSILYLFVVLPTLYPYGYVHYLFGVPVYQPKCSPNSEKYYLTMSTIVRNRAKFMPEWLEFHFMQGVQHVYLYDNNSTDNLAGEVQPYVEANLVTIIPFPHQVFILFDGTHEILTQKLFLKNTIESHACETRWMAMLDTDEFVLPGQNVNQSLQEILKKYERFSALIMPWLYFTSNGWLTTPKDMLVTEAYTRRWTHVKAMWKQIVQPKRINKIYSVHNLGAMSGYHSVNERFESFANWPSLCNGFLMKHVLTLDNLFSYDVIRLHHYKVRSAMEWEERKVTGEISGVYTGLGVQAMKDHWKEYFELEAKPSENDKTTMKYVENLRRNLKKRYHKNL